MTLSERVDGYLRERQAMEDTHVDPTDVSMNYSVGFWVFDVRSTAICAEFIEKPPSHDCLGHERRHFGCREYHTLDVACPSLEFVIGTVGSRRYHAIKWLSDLSHTHGPCRSHGPRRSVWHATWTISCSAMA